jgi:energy-coupling factor transporter transmembrane protein EcfT
MNDENKSEDLSTSMKIEYLNNVRSTYKTYGMGVTVFIMFLVVIFLSGVLIYIKNYNK